MLFLLGGGDKEVAQTWVLLHLTHGRPRFVLLLLLESPVPFILAVAGLRGRRGPIGRGFFSPIVEEDVTEIEDAEDRLDEAVVNEGVEWILR